MRNKVLLSADLYRPNQMKLS